MKTKKREKWGLSSGATGCAPQSKFFVQPRVSGIDANASLCRNVSNSRCSHHLILWGSFNESRLSFRFCGGIHQNRIPVVWEVVGNRYEQVANCKITVHDYLPVLCITNDDSWFWSRCGKVEVRVYSLLRSWLIIYISRIGRELFYWALNTRGD